MLSRVALTNVLKKDSALTVLTIALKMYGVVLTLLRTEIFYVKQGCTHQCLKKGQCTNCTHECPENVRLMY